ncbi:MAG: ADP-heptose--LPS heptosyltransferase 2 [Phycisphaerae bacterium]|nr:ADP-heptose--LPS heptosyltransferase 2 [Phycisphaerae bacterium]
MSLNDSARQLQRILVVLPNWVGDVVLATPLLQQLHLAEPQPYIAALMRPYVQDVLSGAPWIRRVHLWPEQPSRRRAGFLGLAKELRGEKYNSVLLLPNSFRSALLAWWAGIPRRIGYARDYRSWLLTTRIAVPTQQDRPLIESMLDYYGRLLPAMGLPQPVAQPCLFTDQESQSEVQRWWAELKISDERPVVILNPGSSFGPSKLYPTDRYAQVADRLIEQHHAQVLINAGPNEQPIAEALRQAMKYPAAILSPPRMNLRLLKAVIARCDLLITNDTGPRHFAVAFHKPVITIFGSTHPGWTETHHPLERKIQIPIDCGPCQKPVCPLDHRCMTGISPEMILHAANELLRRLSIPMRSSAPTTSTTGGMT